MIVLRRKVSVAATVELTDCSESESGPTKRGKILYSIWSAAKVGQTCTLLLSDGRSGEIVFSNDREFTLTNGLA